MTILDFAPHAVLSLDIAMATASGMNVYVLSQVVFPSGEALAPATIGKIQEAVSNQLPRSTDGVVTSQLVKFQDEKLRGLHGVLLSRAWSHDGFARTQLLAWLFLVVVSAAMAVAQHQKGKHTTCPPPLKPRASNQPRYSARKFSPPCNRLLPPA